jgi:hypothetical protein
MCCFVLSRENPKVKGAICNCVLSSSRSRCVEAPRRPALPPPARRSGHRGEPLETPLGATKFPPSFSPLPQALSPFSVSSPRAPEHRRHCCRPAPPLDASPDEAEVPKSSAAPPVVSPSKELARDALRHRRHRRYPRRHRAPPPPDSSPSVLLRPNRHHRSTQGELLPRLPLLPILPWPPTRASGRRAKRGRAGVVWSTARLGLASVA